MVGKLSFEKDVTRHVPQVSKPIQSAELASGHSAYRKQISADEVDLEPFRNLLRLIR